MTPRNTGVGHDAGITEDDDGGAGGPYADGGERRDEVGIGLVGDDVGEGRAILLLAGVAEDRTGFERRSDAACIGLWS